ncbi:hypothetical protein KP509_39G056400 [Ceratopteris richardii]|uniref:WRKY domain-containing protein n=1 Tax=Ceratopteris richardii TaxID=49495 RepID=A0A8T2Q1K0_CERRI|nr:hypothetical protein KP509_39G056400 [Ceratopteris richardii]
MEREGGGFHFKTSRNLGFIDSPLRAAWRAAESDHDARQCYGVRTGVALQEESHVAYLLARSCWSTREAEPAEERACEGVEEVGGWSSGSNSAFDRVELDYNGVGIEAACSKEVVYNSQGLNTLRAPSRREVGNGYSVNREAGGSGNQTVYHLRNGSLNEKYEVGYGGEGTEETGTEQDYNPTSGWNPRYKFFSESLDNHYARDRIVSPGSSKQLDKPLGLILRGDFDCVGVEGDYGENKKEVLGVKDRNNPGYGDSGMHWGVKQRGGYGECGHAQTNHVRGPPLSSGHECSSCTAASSNGGAFEAHRYGCAAISVTPLGPSGPLLQSVTSSSTSSSSPALDGFRNAQWSQPTVPTLPPPPHATSSFWLDLDSPESFHELQDIDDSWLNSLPPITIHNLPPFSSTTSSSSSFIVQSTASVLCAPALSQCSAYFTLSSPDQREAAVTFPVEAPAFNPEKLPSVLSPSPPSSIPSSPPAAATSRAGNMSSDRKRLKRLDLSEPKYVVLTRNYESVLKDGFKWRKYGQKSVKNNIYPRSYYKCSYEGCYVHKHVERVALDPCLILTTYRGRHNH